MTRHEESGTDFRGAKMRRSEAVNESIARGKMESTINLLNLGETFNAFDATYDQPKIHMFPPSLVNSIETNPDLVSCLLKESLSENKYGSALNAMAEKPVEPVMDTQQPQIPPPPEVMVPLPTVGAPDGDPLQHRNKSEKKQNKKEKLKHKEKDKSKDREERKRHQREKAWKGEKGTPKNPVTLTAAGEGDATG